jgi:hypothetical protein
MLARTAWGLVAAAGAVFCFAMAMTYCVGCTPAQDATIARIDGAIIPWTKTACEVASDAPVPAGWVDLSCTVLEGVELGVEKVAAAGASSSLPTSLTAAAVPPPASTAAAPSPPPIPLAPTANKPATLRLRVPLAAARALAAAHPQTLSLPSKL